jgi:hypothetical protein
MKPPTWPGTGIHTVSSLRRSSRRLDRQRQAVEGAIATMRAGGTLHLQFGPTREWWVLSNGWIVTPEVAAIVIKRPNIVAVGAGLFRNSLGQTWRYFNPKESNNG